MELYPKRQTDDEEHVEFIRNLIKRSKWFGIFHALAAVAFLVMFGVLLYLTHSIRSQMMPEISIGVCIGIIFGAMGGMVIVFAALNISWAVCHFKGLRTERLMVKFHDEIKKKEDTSNHTSEGIRQPADGSAKPSM